MTRRSFCGAAALAAAAPAKRPNIVFVMMDDFGIGQFAPWAQGLRVEQFDPAFTPRHPAAQALDFARRAMPEMLRLAKGGVTFSNSFAPSNLCAPARTGILMGRMPNRDGLYQNSDVEATGFSAGTVLAARLQKAGYATAFIGKWHAGPRDASLREKKLPGFEGSVVESHHPLNNGFDYWFGYNHFQSPFYKAENVWENRRWAGVQEGYNTEVFTQKAIAFMRGARDRQQPFFVQVSYHAVHGPLKPQAPKRYFEKFAGDDYDLSNFYAHVNAVDEGVSAIRAALGEEEWANTLFIFSGDNGAPVSHSTPMPGNAPYAGHKGMFLEGGIRVPLLVHWPARVRGGQKLDALVSTLDVMPTALDAAGIDVPAGLDGRSLLSLCSGKSAKVRDYLAWAGIHARTWGFHRSSVIGENPERRREESPGAWVATDGRYVLRFVTRTPAGLYKDLPDGEPAHYELHDLREDPLERRNLYGKVPQVEADLKAVFARESKAWPAPTKWRRDRWQEMMDAR